MKFRGGYFVYKINLEERYIYIHNNINMSTSCMITLNTYNDLMHNIHNHDNACKTTCIYPIHPKYLNHALIPLCGIRYHPKRMEPTLIPSCNVPLPHLTNSPVCQGKHETKSYYDMT